MGGLPSGTVTMFFSDIEGSTLLLSRLGERYAKALEAQQAVLRAACARWGGHQMGTEGDSFFVVFGVARNAIGAALDAQRGLASESWPGGERVRVRIGVHTGEPLQRADAYVGMDVHRAARIAAAAHGGQIVVSDATRALVGSQLPNDAQLVDLGWHRLKDIAEAEHLYQVSAVGLDVSFPPLRSLGTATSLPAPATALVGRTGELRELRGLLALPEVRLITLTGPGGSGKTRLAIALATESVELFPDGVYFASVALVTTGEGMWRAIAEAVGVVDDVENRSDLLVFMRHRRALLVLDNLEQVAGAPSVVQEVMDVARQLVVVATSRRPLHLYGEHEHPVPPLGLPEQLDLDDVERSGAVRLFNQQARMVRPGFTLTADNAADVVAVCRRLDGLPLAIELAAARIKLMSPAALLRRLDQAVGLRAADVDRPTRQQTLHSTIAWSYDLLSPRLQRVFRQLGVFVGGCDLDAFSAVVPDCPDPFQDIADLVDVSLATIGESPDGEPRVGLLETIHGFALDRLGEENELEEARRRHAEHFLSAAERLGLRLQDSQQLPDAPDFVRQLGVLESEWANISAALTWVCERTDADRALRAAAPLWRFLLLRSHLEEGRRLFQHLLAAAENRAAPESRAAVLLALGSTAYWQQQFEEALSYYEAALRLYSVAADTVGIAEARYSLGFVAVFMGESDQARGLFEDALVRYEELDDALGAANARSGLGLIELVTGHPVGAEALVTKSLPALRAAGSFFGVANSLTLLGTILHAQERAEEAKSVLREAIIAQRDIGNVAGVSWALQELAAVAMMEQNIRHALILAGAANALETGRHARTPLHLLRLPDIRAGAQGVLAAPDVEAAWTSGRALTLEEAVRLALQDC